jgi:hypothetical protein
MSAGDIEKLIDRLSREEDTPKPEIEDFEDIESPVEAKPTPPSEAVEGPEHDPLKGVAALKSPSGQGG